MKQSRTIQGSISKCWDIMLQSLANDYQSATKTTISKKKLATGLTYTKEMKPRIGRAGNVKIAITELNNETQDGGCFYSAEFHSGTGVNYLSYTLTPIDEESFEVLYEEVFQGKTKSKDFNQKIMEVVYSWSIKKQAKKVLENLQFLVSQQS